MLEVFIRELLLSSTAAMFDPPPLTFTKDHRRAGDARLRRLLEQPTGEAHSLAVSLNRSAFLAGCFANTVDAAVEHLIVGLGVVHGTTTKIRAARHEIGQSNRVAVPPDLINQINDHVRCGAKHEALVFHNHPSNPLHSILDNEPLASTADRRLLARARYLQPLIGLKTLLGHGNIRFYVGENGFVREFTTPAIVDLLAFAQRLR